MKEFIVLIAHGSIPDDFPKEKLKTYLSLRSHYLSKRLKDTEKAMFIEIEKELKNWKRNKDNDPHYYSVQQLSKELEKALGISVFFAFNEFCAPLLEEIVYRIEEKEKGSKILVIPLFILRGKHTDKDLSSEIEFLREKYLGVKIEYLFPYKKELVIEFLKKHILENQGLSKL